VNRRTRVFAAVAVVAMALSVLVGAGSAAAADPAPIATYNEDPQSLMPPGTLVVGGASGFLHMAYGTGARSWTSYATGTSAPVTLPVGTVTRTFAMGGDRVAFLVANSTGVAIVVKDFGTGTTETWTVPNGFSVAAMYGQVLIARNTTDATFTAFTMAADGSVASSKPISGLPAGATALFTTYPDGVVASWAQNGALNWGLVDLAAATVTRFTAGPYRLYMSDNWVATYNLQTTFISVYSRAGIADGTDTTARIVTLPASNYVYSPAIVGDSIVATTGQSYAPAVAYPINGGASTTVVPLATGIHQGPGGTALAVGGTGASDWAYRRMVATASGFDDPAVLPLPSTLANAGITISRGLVRHVEALSSPDSVTLNMVFNHALASAPDESEAAGNGTTLGPTSCGGAACVAAVDGPDRGPAYIFTVHGETSDTLGFEGSTDQVWLNAAGARVVDASSHYVLVDTATPAQQKIVKLADLSTTTRPIAAASLWYDTLYSASGVGAVSVQNLATGAVGTTVVTGSGCTPTELQATARWLYWTCGLSGPAGVVDLAARKTIAAPTGRALLGDGYLVMHDASGALQFYDFHGGSFAAPLTIANVPTGPVADDRNIAYAVDRWSGDIVYVDAADAVKVIDPGVPLPSPVIVSAVVDNNGVVTPGTAMNMDLAPNRPLLSWTLTIKDTTGATVYAQTGGATSRDIHASWNGMVAGKPGYSGRYLATLSMVGFGDNANATVPIAPPSGAIQLRCGQSRWRVYGCDGRPAFLAVTKKSNGEAHWFSLNANGTAYDNGPTDFWPSGTTASTYRRLLPYGDFNGDGFNDFFAVSGTGVLWWHQGGADTSFAPDYAYAEVGTGWTMYNTLLSPGDLNGDHTDDIVGRDAKGQLWFYGSVGGGTWKPRVQIAGSWAGYKKLIGAGDLNSDGYGDILAIDGAGVLWRFYGDGKGHLGAGVSLGSGWGGYLSVVSIGDVDGDGRADLLAEDAVGTLWLFKGTATGTFAGKVKVTVSGGWSYRSTGTLQPRTAGSWLIYQGIY
jgi:hypothetical protein